MATVDLSKVQIFETVQGEGIHAGRASFFLRLQGCSVRCFFCDEKATWSKGSHPGSDNLELSYQLASEDGQGLELTVDEILAILLEINPKLKRITITGGEPTEQNLEALIKSLSEAAFNVAVETAASGKYLDALFADYKIPAWITFSPKEIYSKNGKPFSQKIWQRCDELKLVIANEESVDYVLNVAIPSLDAAKNSCPIFITPDWFNFDENKARALELCSEYPSRLRLGTQMHKYLGLK